MNMYNAQLGLKPVDFIKNFCTSSEPNIKILGTSYMIVPDGHGESRTRAVFNYKTVKNNQPPITLDKPTPSWMEGSNK